MARARPSAKPEALTPSGVQIAPVANSRHSVPTIWLGVVKNSLVPADMVMIRGSTSHSNSRTRMPDDAEDRGLEAMPQAAGRRVEIAGRRDIRLECAGVGHCPTRHGNAARSAQRMPSVSTTAMTMMARMQANILSSANRSPKRAMA